MVEEGSQLTSEDEHGRRSFKSKASEGGDGEDSEQQDGGGETLTVLLVMQWMMGQAHRQQTDIFCYETGSLLKAVWYLITTDWTICHTIGSTIQLSVRVLLQLHSLLLVTLSMTLSRGTWKQQLNMVQVLQKCSFLIFLLSAWFMYFTQNRVHSYGSV
ncbi:hypothetical protein AMECASPLE_021726 [Ameca splendens]|uniref:Uncharacterized protein n=1 Tax=Ameca splendens TaxID=208324 RepID=A0ABV0Y467_9TELE